MRINRHIQKALQAVKSKETGEKFHFASLKGFIPYIKSHWKKFAFGSVLMLITSLLALPAPYIMKYIVDDVIMKNQIKILHVAIMALLAIQIVKLIISFLTKYYFSVFNQEIIVQIKKDLFHRILRLPLSFFDNNQTGYLLSRIREVEGLRIFFSNSLVRLLIGMFEFIFSLVILFYLNWKITLAAVFILPLFYMTAKFYAHGIRRIYKEVIEKGAVLSRQIQDSLSGVDVVKIFSAEERETDNIHSHLDELKESNIKQGIVTSFSSELMSLVGAAGGFLVLWLSGIEIINGVFTIGGYIAFTGYLAKLYGPTQSIAMQGLSFQPAITALNRISEFSKITPEEDGNRTMKLPSIEKIKFEEVSFFYGKKQALKNISFTIRKNDKVLITGPNGSGKTTIIKLMLGLYRVGGGQVLINGHDINQIKLQSLRNRISCVSQNVFLFNDTIENNILYSRPAASEEDVEAAAAKSGALDFIDKLDEGMKCEVGEAGRKLSGGEKQRISIARAVLKDSDVIIFDEATAHQDAGSMKRIESLIAGEFRKKICIIISHRPIQKLQLDQVIRLED